MNTPNDDHSKNAPVRPHVADGIQEYDNPLPKWWVGLFYLCTIFAIAYLAYYHFMGGSSLLDELKSASNSQKAASANTAALAVESVDALLKDPEQIAGGKEIFQQNCAACHGQQGEGLIGPNLTDKFWIHGGSPEAIRHTITEGVPDKGMIAWQAILSAEKIVSVTAFILSIKGSNPPNAKAPQGNEEP